MPKTLQDQTVLNKRWISGFLPRLILVCSSFGWMAHAVVASTPQAHIVSSPTDTQKPPIRNGDSNSESEEEVLTKTSHFDEFPKDWMQHPWSAQENRPYHLIRSEVDALLRSHKLTPEVIQQYFSAHKAHPDDPKAVFRWAYACESAAHAGQPVLLASSPDLSSVNIPLAPWSSVEYCRLAFLLASYFAPAPSIMKPLAERLIEHDAGDVAVVQDFVSLLLFTGVPEDKKLAFRLIDRRIRTHPSDPRGYTEMGDAYYTSWKASGSKADAEKGILYMTRFSKMLSKGDPDIGYSNDRIQEMRRGLHPLIVAPAQKTSAP